MTRIAALSTLLCLAAAPGPGRAADREWHPYRDVCEKLHLDALHRAPLAERDRVEARIRLQQETGAPADLPPPIITIASKAGAIRLEPDAEGLVTIPLTDALFEENPPVLTTVPAGRKTRISLELRPVVPAGLSFPLATLLAAPAQATRLLKAEAGLLSFTIPTLRAVVLHYPPDAPQTARLTAPGVDRTLTSDAKGRLRLERDEALERAGAVVTLSARPLRAELDE